MWGGFPQPIKRAGIAIIAKNLEITKFKSIHGYSEGVHDLCNISSVEKTVSLRVSVEVITL